jgi:hypothetical protein
MRTSAFAKSVNIGSVLVLSLLLGHLPLQGDEYVEEFTRVVPFIEGGKVVVETFGGSVIFSGTDGTDVKIEATQTINAKDQEDAQEIFSEFSIKVKEGPSKIKIATVCPRKKGFLSCLFGSHGYGKVRVDYKVMVPREVDLFIDGTSTDVDGDGVSGRVSLDLTSGDVDLKNIGGHVYVDGTSGDVKVVSLVGELSVDNTSGDITAIDITGDVGIDKTSGRVTVENVGGDLFLDGTSCDLYIEKLAGDVEVDLTSGDVEILGLGGGVLHEGTSGDVVIVFEGEPKNSCNINSTSGDIELNFQEVSGLNLKLDTHSGGISARLPDMEIIEVSKDNLRAVVAGGGFNVGVSTSSGDIVIQQK